MITAITGGIGSGKSYISRRIEKELGVSIYDCDAAAKRLIRESVELQQSLSRLVGKDIFPNGELDKQTLKDFITSSQENQQRVNDIVHPAVAEDFKNSGSEWLESAILFESGFNKRLAIDKVICVTAPLEVRIQRIMQRDACSREKALQWINAQMPQEQKAVLSDEIIENK